MGMFDWLFSTREGGPAPVTEGVPTWESRAEKMARQQQMIDQLRQESKQQRASEMIGGGGGGGRWQARPQILVPGNTLGSALAQGAMGAMAGYQQQGQDAAKAAMEAEQRKRMDEYARDYAQSMGGAGANPTQGAAPASVLPQATATRGVAGSSAILTDKTPEQLAMEDARLSESMANMDAVGGMLPPAANTGLPPEGLQLGPEDFMSPQAPNGIPAGALGTSNPEQVLPQAAAGMTDPRAQRFMAAYGMSSLPLGANIGKQMMAAETAAGANNQPAAAKLFALYNSLPDDASKQTLMRMIRADENLNVGSGFLNTNTGTYTGKNLTPGEFSSAEGRVRSAHSTPDAHQGFLNMAGGNGELAAKYKEMRIQADLQNEVARANSQPAPAGVGQQSAPMAAPAPQAMTPGMNTPSALPQSMASERAVRGGMDLNEMATDPSFQPSARDIAFEQLAQAQANPGKMPQSAATVSAAQGANSVLPNAVASTGVAPLVGSAQLKAGEAAATDQAKADVLSKTTREERARNAIDAMKLLGQAEAIFDVDANSDALTGSGFGANVVKPIKEFVGYSSNKTQNDADLNTISKNLLRFVPRFEGPQSDRDIETYKQMAGDIGNPGIPAKDRYVILRRAKAMQENYIRDGTAGDPLKNYGSQSEPTGAGIKNDGTLDAAGWAELERMRAKARARAAGGK